MRNPIYAKLDRKFISSLRQNQLKFQHKKKEVTLSADMFPNHGKNSKFSQSTNVCSLKNSHCLTLSLKPKQSKAVIKKQSTELILPLYKIQLIRQNTKCRKKIKQLQQKIQNQQKMQEFYLQELKYHRECEKDLQWRLSVIFDELKKHNVISWKNRKQSQSTIHSFQDEQQLQNAIQFLQESQAVYHNN